MLFTSSAMSMVLRELKLPSVIGWGAQSGHGQIKQPLLGGPDSGWHSADKATSAGAGPECECALARMRTRTHGRCTGAGEEGQSADVRDWLLAGDVLAVGSAAGGIGQAPGGGGRELFGDEVGSARE